MHLWGNKTVKELDAEIEDQRKALNHEQHPWRVRPTAKKRSRDLHYMEVRRLRTEQGLAYHTGQRWDERGPVPNQATPFWRGQKLRQGACGGKVRYANRGGKNRELYAALARNGRLKP